jgi:outer membrane protein OmpA-like peptidoglycan-associated protein
MKFSIKPATAALAAALATGCATTSEPPAPLQEARSAYSRAQSNPHVPRFAPVELNEAGKALNEAERLWREDAEKDVMAHQAYLAEQRARIAVNTAQARTARAEIARAQVERSSVVAQARRLEAEADRRQAEDARKQTASELAQAERERQKALEAQRQAEQARRQAELATEKMREELWELQAEQTDRGWVVTLGSEVLFDVGEARLKPGARRAIDNLARFLRDHPEQQIAIEGFTDSTGSSDFNLALSQERAQAVKQAIVQTGIDPQRIETRGHGEAFPVASNDTSGGRQLNRRVEVVVPETLDGGSTGISR